MTNTVVGIIPARFASTRFPGKLLHPIQGKTLLQHTYDNARRATVLDKLLIATDCDNIAKLGHSFGAEVIMTSKTCENGTVRLAEAINKHPELALADAVVNIQGDEPCLSPESIDAAVTLLLSDPTANMATLIAPLQHEEAGNPSVVKCVKDIHNNALYFSRSCIPSSKEGHPLPTTPYYRHIGLYVYRPRFLLHYLTLSATPLQTTEDLEQLKVLEHGFKIKVALTHSHSVGVDTPQDIHTLEKWLCKQNISS